MARNYAECAERKIISALNHRSLSNPQRRLSGRLVLDSEKHHVTGPEHYRKRTLVSYLHNKVSFWPRRDSLEPLTLDHRSGSPQDVATVRTVDRPNFAAAAFCCIEFTTRVYPRGKMVRSYFRHGPTEVGHHNLLSAFLMRFLGFRTRLQHIFQLSF